MTKNNSSLSRADKIMISLHEMSKGKKINLKFEDIVVYVFKKFPDDFHLRGYPEHPDTGDLIHKPLYDFRKRGYLEANNKIFSLTDRGLLFSEQLALFISGKNIKGDGRLSRFAENEISRIEKSEAFALFLKDKKDKITDTDFYNYLGVTPRTQRNDFIGRLETVGSAVKELLNQKSLTPPRGYIPNYHSYLLEKFSSIIQYFNK